MAARKPHRTTVFVPRLVFATKLAGVIPAIALGSCVARPGAVTEDAEVDTGRGPGMEPVDAHHGAGGRPFNVGGTAFDPTAGAAGSMDAGRQFGGDVYNVGGAAFEPGEPDVGGVPDVSVPPDVGQEPDWDYFSVGGNAFVPDVDFGGFVGVADAAFSQDARPAADAAGPAIRDAAISETVDATDGPLPLRDGG